MEKSLDQTIAERDFCDFPTGWKIQRECIDLEHDPRCSGPSFLCDCGAIIKEWERRRALVTLNG